MRRRRFLGLTAGLATAAGLPASACGGDTARGETELKLLAIEYGDAADLASTESWWNQVVNEFRKGSPDIRVDVSVVPERDANLEVARRVARGEAPDIAQIHEYADLAAADLLLPTDDLLSIPVLADFVPSLATAGEVGHVSYAMPFSARVWRMFCNRELFTQAGLDPRNPPSRLEDLPAAAEALREAGVPVPFGLPLNHSEAHAEAMMWMLCGGGGLTDATGSYTIDSPENVATFTWLRDELVVPGLTGPLPPAVTSREKVYEGFAAGEVGMLFGDPLLMRRAGTAGIDFTTAALPGQGGPTASTLGESSWLLAFNQHNRPEAIGAFLNFVYTTDRISSFAESYELLPVATPAVQEMSSAMSGRNGERGLGPFLEELPGASFYPVGKVSWTRTSYQIAQDVGDVLRAGSDVPASLGRLQGIAREAEADAAELEERTRERKKAEES